MVWTASLHGEPFFVMLKGQRRQVPAQELNRMVMTLELHRMVMTLELHRKAPDTDMDMP